MKIIDNLNNLLGDELQQTLTPNTKLKIAASCFSIYAYEALKKELAKIDSLEFIFTSPTFVADEVTDKFKKEKREFFIPKAGRERSLYGTDFEIQLKNKLTQKAIAKECANWIRKKATFKSNKTDSPMQSFVVTEAPRQQTETMSAVFAPVSGFTAVDLGYQRGNAISNFVQKIDEPNFTAQYLQLFDQIWKDPAKLQDVTKTICEHIESVYQENSPEKVYFIILYNIFNEFLDDITEDVLPNDRTGYQDTLIWNKLFNYQKDAATGIINKLETYNGCILADSVGLGKTFTALAVIKYYELRNKSVLLLCPKKLADNWLNFNRNLKTNIFAKDRFSYDVLCHTDLSRTSGESFGTPLNRINWGNYDLVVIDESHNFRNNDAVKDRETRYQKLMNKVIRAGVKTKVLMLSATPVNNRFTDLRNQLALAYEGESSNLTKHLKTTKSVEQIFNQAQAAFNAWSKLDPETRTAKAILDALDFDFFELLDSVTIARSRKHITTFYDTTDIGHFPERNKPISFHCPLTTRSDVVSLNEIFEQLKLLKLSVYAPVSYILPSRLKKYEEMYDTEVEGGKGKLKQSDREKSLVALMTTNLLKRLESSVYSFRSTLQSLHDNHVRVLGIIDEFYKRDGQTEVSSLVEALESIEADEDDMPSYHDMEIGNKIKIKLMDMDLPSWQQDLDGDLKLIKGLLDSVSKIKPEEDAKLQHLKSHIAAKINNPINPGNRKIIVFTAFADTAQYLYEQLSPVMLSEHRIHTAMITGGASLPKTTLKTGRKGYDTQEVLTLFSPVSKSKASVLPDESAEIDLLIATDCISEGQNLQDCDYLINFDIHWNPVRIVQRFGRVDRIGSPNKCIQLVNYWPDISLDEYINLKERVESRMTIVDVTATGDDNVLSSQANDVSYRKEQLKKLQEEVIELEDLKTGVSITDLGLNEFRMDLLNLMKLYGEPRNAPSGMHAVVEAKPELGLLPGVVFALKNVNNSIDSDLQNRLHPYYLVYVSNEGHIVANHFEVKRLLDLIRSSCKGQTEPLSEICALFNRLTQDGRDMQRYSHLLTDAIKSMVEVKEEKDIDSLFSGGATSALVNTFAGLDDFELLAFVVIQQKQLIEHSAQDEVI
ncbi:ATP-dependent helicase [Escherichia coli]|nr:SNF2-related protein [Escherichia coli]AOO35069.1 helicase [Escherichia coli]AXT78712.1 helicase [Escherichia coli]EEX1868259.1 ATP-dependent helicase [Escherichia coli]EFH8144448.1 ATP-dependent helicase [Escherichia coli]EFN5245395.1 ATP-dependent helicase [Escherichia coli]